MFNTDSSLVKTMLKRDPDGVIPVSRGIDQAPPVEEREIGDVDFEAVDDRRTVLTQQKCQHCGNAVDLLEVHTAATLWSSHTDTTGRIMYKPVFCDRWCWLDWLRTAESA